MALPSSRPHRLLPLALLAGGLALAWGLGLDRFLTLEALESHRQDLLAWRDQQPILAGAGYVALYALTVAASIPGATVLTLAGGLLFGTLWGTIWAVLGASLGASALFLIARYGIEGLIAVRAGSRFAAFREGFRSDAFSYLLALRLAPLFPFWLVNLGAAGLGVRFEAFAASTVLGIIPGAVVYAGLGNGLGALIEAGRTPDMTLIFSAEVLWPLIGLAVLSLLPVLWRKWWNRTHGPVP